MTMSHEMSDGSSPRVLLVLASLRSALLTGKSGFTVANLAGAGARAKARSSARASRHRATGELRTERRDRRLVCAAVTAMLGVLGCVTVQAIGEGQTVELGPDEGILVVHLSSNVPVETLSFGFGSISHLPEGDHVILFATSAGSYQWSNLRVTAPGRPRFRLNAADDWSFRVEPGHISYPGMLELELQDWWHLGARAVDRSAVAVETLRKDYAELLARYPIVYTGVGRNVFFERYREVGLPERAESPGRLPQPEAKSSSP